MENRKLIFVYAADSGAVNTLLDIAHKVVSPKTYSCNLCGLTHGIFRQREEWKGFLEKVPVPCEFLHRDELARKYPDVKAELPVIFVTGEEGTLSVLMSAAEINRCKTTAELIAEITRRIASGP
jgi:hypothetical protein